MSEVRQGNGAVASGSPLKKVVLASNNAGKLREFAALLGAAGIDLIPQGELNVPEAEEPHPTGPFRSDRPLGHNAPLFAVGVGNGRHLDHEAAFGQEDDERGVIEVTWWAPLNQR